MMRFRLRSTLAQKFLAWLSPAMVWNPFVQLGSNELPARFGLCSLREIRRKPGRNSNSRLPPRRRTRSAGRGWQHRKCRAINRPSGRSRLQSSFDAGSESQ